MARTKAGLRFHRTLNGATPAMLQVPLVQTAYYDGNVLRVNGTTGSAALCAAGGTTATYVLQGNVTNANAATGKYPVYLLDANNVFEGTMLATGARQKRMTDLCGIAVGSTYNYRLAATAGPFRIVGNDPLSTGTGASGRYYVVGNYSQLVPVHGKLSTE